jgi:hypothetical protein
MLLTSDQYRRGLVKWWGDSKATVVIASRDGSVKSAPMSDHTGSVPEILVEGGGQLEVIPVNGDVIIPPFRVTSERLLGDEIEVQGFDTELGRFHLVGMIALGRFDRLVVSAPYLRWDDGWVVRVDDVMVRLTNRMSLERTSDTEFVHHDETHSTYTTTLSTHRLEAWFLDIIAPQTLGEDREIAYSVLGLLALILSDAAVGDVVQLDRYAPRVFGDRILTECETQGLQHTIFSAPNRTLRMPLLVREVDLQEFDRLLNRVTDDLILREDVLLPLRWYERALRAGSEMDQYMAAVIGIDSLVTRRSKRLGFVSPIAELLADQRVADLLAPLRDDYPDDQVDRLISRLLDKNPSMKDRFAGVAERAGLDAEARSNFRKAIDDRGPLLHGSTGVIEEGLAKKAVELLAALLHAQFDGLSGHVKSPLKNARELFPYGCRSAARR